MDARSGVLSGLSLFNPSFLNSVAACDLSVLADFGIQLGARSPLATLSVG